MCGRRVKERSGWDEGDEEKGGWEWGGGLRWMRNMGTDAQMNYSLHSSILSCQLLFIEPVRCPLRMAWEEKCHAKGWRNVECWGTRDRHKIKLLLSAGSGIGYSQICGKKMCIIKVCPVFLAGFKQVIHQFWLHLQNFVQNLVVAI